MSLPAADTNQQVFNLLQLLHDAPPYVATIVKNTDKTRTYNAAYETTAKLVTAAKRAAATGSNLFVKMARFNGTTNPAGRPSCKSEHVIGNRSILLDIDGKDYPSLADAFSALEAARTGGNLPPFQLVQCSGHGLHAVYILDEELPPQIWTAMVRTLHNSLGPLKHDRQAATIDKGLRLCGPDYPNCKDPAAPAPTDILHLSPVRLNTGALRAVLGRLMEAGPRLVAIGGVRLNEFSTHAQFDLQHVATECEAVKEALTTGGAAYEYPAYIGLVTLAAASLDGWEWAKRMSKGHETYDKHQLKVDFNSFDPGNRPVITCARLGETQLGAACARCKWAGQVKSPQGIIKKLAELNAAAAAATAAEAARTAGGTADSISAASMNAYLGAAQMPLSTTTAVVQGPLPFALPPNYRNKQGVLQYQNIDGEWDKAANFAVRDLKVYELVGTAPIVRHIRVDTERWQGGNALYRQTLDIEQSSALADQRVLYASLSRQGVPISKADGSVHTSMVQLFNHVRTRDYLPGYNMTDIGWHGDALVADAIYTPKGRSLTAGMFNNESPQPFLTHEGSQPTYVDICDTVLSTDPRPEAHMMVLIPLASLLVEPCHAEPGMLTVHGDTGAGKTSISRLALSTLGPPEPMPTSGTANYLMSAISQRRVFAAFVDEFDKLLARKNSIEVLREYLFTMPSGAMRNRLKSDGTLNPMPAYRGLAVFISNCNAQFLTEQFATGYNDGAAVQARLIDLLFRQPPTGIPGVDQALASLRSHHGWLLRPWCDYAARNIQLLTQLYALRRAHYMQHYTSYSYGTEHELRFVATFAALISTASAAVQGLAAQWHQSELPPGVVVRGEFPLRHLDHELVEAALDVLPAGMATLQIAIRAKGNAIAALNNYLDARSYSAPLTRNGKIVRQPRQMSFTAMPYAIDDGLQAILVVRSSYESWFESNHKAHKLAPALRDIGLPTQEIPIDGHGYTVWVVPWNDFPAARAGSWKKRFDGVGPRR